MKTRICILGLSLLLASTLLSSVKAYANDKPVTENKDFQFVMDETERAQLDIEFIGVEDSHFLTGEVFYFKKDIQLLVNGEDVGLKKLKIVNSKGKDISKISSVKLEYPGTYKYTYSYLDKNNQMHSKLRTITVGDPNKTTAEILKNGQRNISIHYFIPNEYQSSVKVLLQDWALFPMNHDEQLGILQLGQTLSFSKQFTVVPVFERSDNIPAPPVEEDPSVSPDYDVLYTMDGQISFQPTFTFKSIENEEKLSRFSRRATLDMGDLVDQMRQASNQIEISTFMETRDRIVGEEATLFYEVMNHSSVAYDVQLADWNYYGVHKKVALGTAFAESKTLFKQKVLITPDMIDTDGQLKESIASLHFLNVGEQQFVLKNINSKEVIPPVKVEYLDISGRKLIEDTLISGEYGDQYEASPAEITGYSVKEPRPANEIGLFGKTEATITYIYEAIKDPTDPEGNTSGGTVEKPEATETTQPKESTNSENLSEKKQDTANQQLPETSDVSSLGLSHLGMVIFFLISLSFVNSARNKMSSEHQREHN